MKTTVMDRKHANSAARPAFDARVVWFTQHFASKHYCCVSFQSLSFDV